MSPTGFGGSRSAGGTGPCEASSGGRHERRGGTDDALSRYARVRVRLALHGFWAGFFRAYGAMRGLCRFAWRVWRAGG